METNNTTKILNALYDEAKNYCHLILDDNGTPSKDKIVCRLIETMMQIAGDIIYPDLTPITTAVCHYVRTFADEDQARRAVISLTQLQDLMVTLHSNSHTLDILENALARYDSVREEVLL